MFPQSCACALILGTAISIQAQDTNPPVLVASVPTNNAQNVPVNTAISFTFNEPMFTGYSIDWSYQVPTDQELHYWSQDQQTFFCLFQVPLPPNSFVTWELNPPEYSPSFRNLAGTPLPSGLYQGSFTTGTSADQLQIASISLSGPQQIHLRIVGTAGKQVVLYASTNLTNWVPWATNGPSSNPIDLTNSPSPFPPQQFYNAAVITTPP
jgi:hypothetical protein